MIPPSVAPLDMDIIKLTAQFVARNGQNFLEPLSKREEKPPQFDFMRPTSDLFGFFMRNCDAYTNILAPKDQSQLELTQKMANNKQFVLGRGIERYKYMLYFRS